MELPHLFLVETPRDARIEASGKGGTAMRMGRNQHQIAFFDPMPFAHRLHDLAMLFTRKDVNVGADQDAAMPRLVFECESSGPEVRCNALCRPVPMAVSSQPSKFFGRDLCFGCSCSEFLRESRSGRHPTTQ